MRVLMLALMLSGCATTAEMQTKAPKHSYSSSKTTLAAEECVGLQLSWLTNPSTIRGEDKTIMSYGSGASTVATVTITPQPSGSTIELRGVSGARVRRSLARCV